MATREFRVSEVIGKQVYTDKGSFCGKVSDIELDLSRFKVHTILVDAARNSYLANVVGSKRGVKIPYQMIRALDDIVITKHIRATIEEPTEVPPE